MTAPTPRPFRQWEVWRVVWDDGDGRSSRRPALLLVDDIADAPRAKPRFMLISGVDHPGIARIKPSPGDPAFGMTGLTKPCFIYVANAQDVAKAEIGEIDERAYPETAIAIGEKSKNPLDNLDVPARPYGRACGR